MSKAWTYQKTSDLEDVGEARAPWFVGWYEPDGRRKAKSCGAGKLGKSRADKLSTKITSKLMTGTYQQKTDTTWDDFMKEYERRILAGLAPESRRDYLLALAHFKRLARPAKVFTLDTGRIDDYIAARRKEPGLKPGSLVSPATVNKELRVLKAVFHVAEEWGYVAKVPRFRMEKTVKKLPRYVTPEHFAAIYAACDTAQAPAGLPYPPADWWRGLLVMAYMTGWRIGDLLAFRRADLDLAGGYAVTRGEDNKGGRDDRVKLHPVAAAHLEKLASLKACVFPWEKDVRTLNDAFDRIQRAAGIHLACPGRHQHTPSCHLYGFHDLRRAFATMNANRLTADALQALMRHKSYLTTQVYINMARQIDEAVNLLHVPDFLKGGPPQERKQA